MDRMVTKSDGLPVRIGYWMSLLIAAWMGVNTARALLAPDVFAASFGLPGAQATDLGFVQVYAFRAFFLGAFALLLVLRREGRLLGWFALVAVIMPVGDAALTAQAGAGPATVGRHVAIAVYLVFVAVLLLRAPRRT